VRIVLTWEVDSLSLFFSTLVEKEKGRESSKNKLEVTDMTRKHFIALANAIRESHNLDELVDGVADVCAEANSNFDRQRFMDACHG